MKLLSALFFLSLLVGTGQAQTLIHGAYKGVTITLDQNVPYSKTLILLHEIYDGSTMLSNNFAVGTIMAIRGAVTSLHRLNVINITSGSAYNSFRASLSAHNVAEIGWKLKTCTYNGKRYMALDVPYSAPQHTQGFHFVGWAQSSGESLKTVTYEVNGVPQNQALLSNVEDYNSTMVAQYDVERLVVNGNVGIGTTTPQERLSVNGNIRAKEVKVEMDNWPDYVFTEGYALLPLAELETHIKTHGHLPGMPSAEEAEADGIGLAEMNRKLLEKVEELTLHLIEQQKALRSMEGRLNQSNTLGQLSTH